MKGENKGEAKGKRKYKRQSICVTATDHDAGEIDG